MPVFDLSQSRNSVLTLFKLFSELALKVEYSACASDNFFLLTHDAITTNEATNINAFFMFILVVNLCFKDLKDTIFAKSYVEISR